MNAKFRGKRKDNKEWAYGFPIITINRSYIARSPARIIGDILGLVVGDIYEVVPSTVGQFTGWYDAFTGDRIKRKDGIVGTVFWSEKMFLFAIMWDDGASFPMHSYIGECNIIGTIHDAEGGK